MRVLYTEDEATVIYNATIIACKNGYIKGRKYKSAFQKVKDGYECNSKDIRIIGKKEEKENSEMVISATNLNRCKNTLIEYASENADMFHSFITLTFEENITDINEANKKFHSYITMVKRVKNDFVYLGVPEFQKRGAVHYHLLTNLVCDIDIPKRELKRLYNEQEKKYTELEYYDLPYWNNGYSSAFNLDMTDEKFNVALYITKYLYKDIDNRLWGHKKILKSNDLRKPSKYFIEDNETYKKAMEYIKEKGYQMAVYDFRPQEPYQVPFTQMTAFISQSDCNTIKDILKNEYSLKI